MTRLLVTRPDGQAGALATHLQDRGFEVVALPTVAIEPPSHDDIAALRAALPGADWVVVTSANGVPALASAIRDDRLAAATRLAAVGPATAAALEAAGFSVAAMPARYLTVDIADALGDVRARRVVLARAEAATPDLRDALLARGAAVEEVIAYRTIEGPMTSRDAVRDAIGLGVDGILFTSGSTVRGLLALVPPHLRGRVTCLPTFCIGPVTAEVARRAGFVVAGVADEHTATDLARTTIHHFQPEAS